MPFDFFIHAMCRHGREAYWIPLLDNESPKKYADEFSGFLVTTLRCINGHASQYNIPLTDHQKSLAQSLWVALLASLPDTLDTLHTFLWSISVEQMEADDPSEWSCPLRCYLAARATRSDGNFISPGALSEINAKFKYLFYNVALYHANRTRADHGSLIK
jgi:hypothetical protein